MINSRYDQLNLWTKEIIGRLRLGNGKTITLEKVAGDASFRRYFRVWAGSHSFMAVDAPPENEDGKSFENICNLFQQAGLAVPKVHSADHDRGFMLLDDLGDTLYLDALRDAQQLDQIGIVEDLYQRAIFSLLELSLIHI